MPFWRSGIMGKLRGVRLPKVGEHALLSDPGERLLRAKGKLLICNELLY